MKWKHINIHNGNTSLFCNTYITSKASINIIVTHTPVCSTLDIQAAYEPLTRYPVNIFAFDFSGTGKSSGREEAFSLQSIVSDLDTVVHYIKTNYSTSIHLYGNTGIGGMFAQYYVCTTNQIKSFAQFACVDYKNTRGIGYSYFVIKVLSWWLKILPNFHITSKPPKYMGYNSELDNSFYEKMLELYPNFFKCSTKIMNAMLECFVAPDSAIQNEISIPTLLFKTLHDRYFKKEYFDSYYGNLHCKKKLIEIDDIHNSYYFRNEEFCAYVYQWFNENN